MIYEMIDRPEPYDPGQRARALRQSEREPFNQELYDALKDTLKGGAVKLRVPQFTLGPNVPMNRDSAAPTRTNAVDQGVRRRLLDKEGYCIKSERIDEDFVGVWIFPEVLWCSATKQQFIVPEWIESEGWRRRKGYRSPYDPTGVLVESLDKLERRRDRRSRNEA